MDGDQRELLEAARQSFPGFYAAAPGEEKLVFDGLVLAHAAVAVGINAPREGVEPELRTAVERATNHSEQVFSALRESVRLLPTFQRLSVWEQLVIERVLFQVEPPLDSEM